MLQVEGELRRAGVARVRVHLQAAQDHLLQPARQLGLERARRQRVAVQAPAQPGHAGGIAEGALAGSKVVQGHAQGEEVAARIAAHAQHLLGRDVGAGAHGQVELLGQQVGQLRVVGEAEVDQHGGAVGAEQHVARLHVEVDDVLRVQRLQRQRHARADVRDFFRRQRRLRQARAQRLARHALHHQVRLRAEVTGGDEARHMRAGEARQDHLLHLETDDGGRIVVGAQARDLHDQRQGMLGVAHAPQRGHAAAVQRLLQAETVNDRAGFGFVCGHAQPPLSRRRASASGRPAARTLAAAVSTS